MYVPMQAQYLAFVLIGSLTLSGCFSSVGDRPPIEAVTGIVTLNGEPLPQATIMFHPQGEEGGRRSIGVTDEDGRYELIYMQGADTVYGAKVGLHNVIITTRRDEDAEGGDFKELIPQRYRGRNTELTANIESGVTNRLDFDLVSR